MFEGNMQCSVCFCCLLKVDRAAHSFTWLDREVFHSSFIASFDLAHTFQWEGKLDDEREFSFIWIINDSVKYITRLWSSRAKNKCNFSSGVQWGKLAAQTDLSSLRDCRVKTLVAKRSALKKFKPISIKGFMNSLIFYRSFDRKFWHRYSGCRVREMWDYEMSEWTRETDWGKKNLFFSVNSERRKHEEKVWISPNLIIVRTRIHVESYFYFLWRVKNCFSWRLNCSPPRERERDT